MGEMAVLNHEGHTSIEWDPENADQVAAARAMWDRLVGERHYSAFELDEDGERGRRVREFSPQLGRCMLVPQLQGG